MPVVVTGADEPVGRAVALALAADAGAPDVRATVGDRAAVAELVGRGVRTAVWDGADVQRLGGVVEGAHTVLHLRGGPRGALAGVPDVLAAAADSGVRRVVTLAPPGRLAAAGRDALDALRGSGYDAVVLRVAAVAGPGWRLRARRRPTAVPAVRLADLVAALLAADRARDVRGWVDLRAGDRAALDRAFGPGR